jgi:hypothetical protein
MKTIVQQNEPEPRIISCFDMKTDTLGKIWSKIDENRFWFLQKDDIILCIEHKRTSVLGITSLFFNLTTGCSFRMFDDKESDAPFNVQPLTKGQEVTVTFLVT